MTEEWWWWAVPESGVRMAADDSVVPCLLLFREVPLLFMLAPMTSMQESRDERPPHCPSEAEASIAA